MVTIQEAIKSGNRFTRKDYDNLFVSKHGNIGIENTDNMFKFDSEDILATDWQIIEDKQPKKLETLSDKQTGFNYDGKNHRCYLEEDVKEAIQKFVNWCWETNNLFTLKEKAKEIFGDRLID
jgi:hypothetical protein